MQKKRPVTNKDLNSKNQPYRNRFHVSTAKPTLNINADSIALRDSASAEKLRDKMFFSSKEQSDMSGFDLT